MSSGKTKQTSSHSQLRYSSTIAKGKSMVKVFTKAQIINAVNLATGDDGRISEEVIEILLTETPRANATEVSLSLLGEKLFEDADKSIVKVF